MTRVAIVQPNYLPWKGYFDLVASVDTFVLLDDVQYTRRDWRNRNRLKTPSGTRWFTVPVVSRGRYLQKIDEVELKGSAWARGHLDQWRANYRGAACFARERDWLESLFLDVAPRFDRLAPLNAALIDAVCARLKITTPRLSSRDLPGADEATDRLLTICRALDATTYLSGPAARGYLDVTRFEDAGIAVEWMHYDGYPTYDQVHPPFEHGVSVLDLILHTGDDAVAHLARTKEARA